MTMTRERARSMGAELTPAEFRSALGYFPSGVTVVAGVEGDVPVGFTCQSFYSVSLDPPLVSFSVMLTSKSYPRIRTSGRFAVNVLAASQAHLAMQFARSGSDKWADVGWQPSRHGNPLLDEAHMWLDCELFAEQPAGDHVIVVAEVLDFGVGVSPAAEPLVFHRGRFRGMS